MDIRIREGTVWEVIKLSNQIPEFHNPYGKEEYEKRFEKDHLILIATFNGNHAGFKVGYDRFDDGSFYSWFGGVKPEFRQKGIASKMQKDFEHRCQQRGYGIIRFKTLNMHGNMIRFGIKNGFHIYDFKRHSDPSKSKIYFEKAL